MEGGGIVRVSSLSVRNAVLHGLPPDEDEDEDASISHAPGR